MNPTIIDIICDVNDNTRSKILQVFRSRNIKCSRIYPNTSTTGFKISIYDGLSEVYSKDFFHDYEELRDAQILLPQRQLTARSVVVKKFDQHVLSYSDNDIISDINERETNIRVVQLSRFPSGKIFKLTFENELMVDRVLKTGIYILNVYIPAIAIEREKNAVRRCYRCYDNTHQLSKCSKPVSYKICSICSSTDHTYKECQSSTRKCINCQGSHNALSLLCKFNQSTQKCSTENIESARDQLRPAHANIQQDANSQQDGSNRTNSKPIPINPPVPQHNGLLKEDAFRGYMSLIIATSLTNSPAEFEKNLNILLEANNLPYFKTGGIDVSNIISTNNHKPPQPTKLRNPLENDVNSPFKEALLCNNKEVQKENNPSLDHEEPANTQLSKVSSEQNIKPSEISKSGTKMKLRNKKCNLYIKSSTLKLGKGVCLATELTKKCAVIEHFCTNEANCTKLISKRISAGDLTELSVYDLNDKKFNEKYSILHSVVS